MKNPPQGTPQTEELKDLALNLYQRGKNEVKLEIYIPYAVAAIQLLIGETIIKELESWVGHNERVVSADEIRKHIANFKADKEKS